MWPGSDHRVGRASSCERPFVPSQTFRPLHLIFFYRAQSCQNMSKSDFGSSCGICPSWQCGVWRRWDFCDSLNILNIHILVHILPFPLSLSTSFSGLLLVGVVRFNVWAGWEVDINAVMNDTILFCCWSKSWAYTIWLGNCWSADLSLDTLIHPRPIKVASWHPSTASGPGCCRLSRISRRICSSSSWSQTRSRNTLLSNRAFPLRGEGQNSKASNLLIFLKIVGSR